MQADNDGLAVPRRTRELPSESGGAEGLDVENYSPGVPKANIDWHDFVIAATIDFEEEKEGEAGEAGGLLQQGTTALGGPMMFFTTPGAST